MCGILEVDECYKKIDNGNGEYKGRTAMLNGWSNGPHW